MANELNQEMENEEVENEEVENEERDYDAEARDMGWVEETKYRGPKGQWVDAKTFVEKGEHILPILRANRDKLRQENLTKDKEIANLKATVEANNKAVKALQKIHNEETDRRVDAAIKETKEKLKLAHEAGDFDAVVELNESLTDLKESKKEAKEEEQEAKHPNTNDQGELTADFKAWHKENAWFGNMDNPEDRKRTREIYRIGEDLRDEGDTTQGRPFFDKCLEILEEREGKKVSNQSVRKSRVEGNDNTQRKSGGRAFDNLPKEAKEACHDYSETLVGPGKMYKTVKEWEDAYAKTYNEE